MDYMIASVMDVSGASSHQPIQILIRPHHLYIAQRMAVRQVVHHKAGFATKRNSFIKKSRLN